MNARSSVLLKDPVVVYSAADNLEAHLISTQLNDVGIAAYTVEDTSTAGVAALGLLHNIHRPQVFVDRDQQFHSAKSNKPDVGEFCYHCGAESQSMANSCGAVLESDNDHPALSETESDIGQSMNAFFRTTRKWYAIANLVPIAGMIVLGIIGVVLVLVRTLLRW